jgi:pimeloyl-ACP methyl ester carboxylesterase
METVIDNLSGPIPVSIEVPSDASHMVVLSHGIFVDRNENGRFPRLAQALSDQGIGSVRPDLPGHGENPTPSAQTSVTGMALALADTISWSLKNYQEVSVVASSFSGALLSLVADRSIQEKLFRMVFLNPVLDFRNVFIKAEMPEMGESFTPEKIAGANQEGSFFPVPQFEMSREFLFDLHHIDVTGAYLRLSRPHLFIHGTEDELVSFRRAREIALSNIYSELVEIEGAVHAFTQSGHEAKVWEIVKQYLTVKTAK